MWRLHPPGLRNNLSPQSRVSARQRGPEVREAGVGTACSPASVQVGVPGGLPLHSQAPDSALPWKLLPRARASPWRPRLLTPVSAHSASGRPAWRSQKTQGRGLPIPQERRRPAPGPGEPDLGGPASPSSHGWPRTRISPLPPPAPVTPPLPESQDQLWLVLRFLPIFPFEQMLSSVLREI